ncbi:MAG: hypothetical protein LBH00_04185 [Planctomycetaceae bacterium]|nr:hypothetical protein [Planctomycetaceae bacterium]
MFHRVKQVLPGMLLTACVFACCGNVHAAVKSSAKQQYSSRPAGYVVPVPYYGIPAVPRFMLPAVPGGPGLVSAVSPEAGATLAPQVPAAPAETVPPPPEKIFILREPAAETNVADEIDQMNARLAKIQLEKHQLQAALTHVKKIKSQVFKVKTIAGLAEYVSRDKNYLTEYDELYRLTVAGIEALDKKQPFDVVPGDAPVNAVPPAEVNDPPKQPDLPKPVPEPEPPKPVTITEPEPPIPVPIPDPPPPDKPDPVPVEVPAPEPPIPPPDIPVSPPPGNTSSPETAPPALPNDGSSSPLTIPPPPNTETPKRPEKKRLFIPEE